MKKFIILLSCLLIPFFIACDCNGPYRTRMLEYYSVDSNFKELNGTIIEIEDEHMLEIKILTTNHDFPILSNGYQEFEFYTSSVSDYNLKVGDNITFISAPRYFYDGHHLPIVALSKDGQQLLSFEQGKNDYLKWIKEEF